MNELLPVDTIADDSETTADNVSSAPMPEAAVNPPMISAAAAPAAHPDSMPAIDDQPEELPAAESDEEVEEALRLIDEFADEAATQHAQESARLNALERQLSTMRALVTTG